MSPQRLSLAVLFATLPVISLAAQAQDAADASQQSQAPETQQAPAVTIGEKGSAQDPLSGKDSGLATESQQPDKVQQVEGILGVPALNVKIDPRVLGVAPGEPLPSLRREGEAIRKRDGRLLPTGERGYAVFILDPDPSTGDEQPLAMVIAPCMTLESMERLLEDRGEALRFTLTGEVHTYRGVNYLLPTSQPKPWLIARDTGEKPVDELGNSTTATDSGPTPTGQAPQEPANPQPKPEDQAKPEDQPKPDQPTPSADEVLEQLLNERHDAPVRTQTQETGADTPPKLEPTPEQRLLTDPLLLGLDPDQPQAQLKKEGEFLVARTGRLIRSSDGAHALFVLDSERQGAPEPPMIMQACKLLETMEQTVREQGDAVPFVVTGQVFVYRGANYLLPTIVKREFDRGNLE